MARGRIQIVFKGSSRQRALERTVVTAAARLEELDVSAFIGWAGISPDTHDEILKELHKLEEAVRLLRAEGAIT